MILVDRTLAVACEYNRCDQLVREWSVFAWTASPAGLARGLPPCACLNQTLQWGDQQPWINSSHTETRWCSCLIGKVSDL